jgi:microcystin-dependent protein
MAALTKIAQKIFASTAGVDQVSVFGSLFAGSETFTADAADVQNLSNFLTGWYEAVIGGNAPTIQDMNGLHFLLSYQLAYLQQYGVAQWDAETEYQLGSIVNEAGTMYVSLQAANTNHAITDSAWWRANGAEPTGTGKDFWGLNLPSGYVWASGKTIGNASSNATERANADTLALFTLFWNDFTNTTLPIYTSAGVLSTRGANATADWAANKAIAIPDKRGRVSIGKDNMGGTSANRITDAAVGIDGDVLGDSGGAETQTLTSAQMPTHTHTQDAHTHTQNSHTHLSGPSNNYVYGGGGSTRFAGGGGFETEMNTINTGSTTATNQNTTATNQNTGGGGAHENVQPSIVCNYIIKL